MGISAYAGEKPGGNRYLMPKPETDPGGGVRLAELFGALSLFADLADGFPPEKVLRTAILAVELGKLAGVSAEELRDTYYVSLLRYTGCVGFSHEEAHEYGAGDDIGVRRVMAMADVTNPARTARDVIRNVGRGAPLVDRAKAVFRLLSDASAATRHAHAQCETSLWLARVVGMRATVVGALEQICERYDGRGAPAGTSGDGLVVPIRLHHVADIAEIAFHRHGAEAAADEVRRRRGRHLDPSFSRLFLDHAQALLSSLEETEVWARFLAAEPAPHAIAESTGADDVARAFGSLADIKSVFTIEHSRRVATLAEGAAGALGFDAALKCDLVRASWLHDMGRVAIPNGIWDKPGPLSFADWERVRLHAYYTERIVRRAGALASVANLASAAHERTDASGYPRSLAAAAQQPAARVLAAADVLAALGEARPHRKALTGAECKDVLFREARAGRLDRESVDAVLSAAGMLQRTPARGVGLTARELEVLRLLAIGKSNLEIGTLLGISARTVQNHVAHVYDKIGAHSRAGATLYAVERGLLAAQ
jgi:HD-GYP domain-containing protein (c-di-GMP phosphodiesterase class II)